MEQFAITLTSILKVVTAHPAWFCTKIGGEVVDLIETFQEYAVLKYFVSVSQTIILDVE